MQDLCQVEGVIKGLLCVQASSCHLAWMQRLYLWWKLHGLTLTLPRGFKDKADA